MALKKRWLRRGIYFTIDSIIAAGIIGVVILLISAFYLEKKPKSSVNYAAQDLTIVFSTMTIAELKGHSSFVEGLINSSDITNENLTILEQIGDFWAQDRIGLAQNFTKNLTEDLFPPVYGFSVLVNKDPMHTRDVPLTKSLVSARRMVSGIAKAKPTDGFTSRVLLSGIKGRRTSSYAYFEGYEGDGNLTKKIFVSDEVTSFNGSYIEIDTGGNFSLYINDHFSGNYLKGSGGGGFMLADKWNISNSYLSNFKAGENTIKINFTSGGSYIAGGFLRVTYFTDSFNNTEKPGHQQYWLPGIDGTINLYSSIYFPVEPDTMNLSLHFLSPYNIYLSLGNIIVYSGNGSSQDQFITVDNSNLSSFLDYSSLTEKTLPLRMGILNTSFLGNVKDVVLTTDRTGSMATCDVNIACGTPGICDNDASGGCHELRWKVARDSDYLFLETIINVSGNRASSVGFGSQSNPVCDYHDFSDNITSLKNRVSLYDSTNQDCGNTCIACGIVAATELFIEKQSLHDAVEKFSVNATPIHVGGTTYNISANESFNLSFDKNKFIKSRLTFLGNSSSDTTASGNQYCVFFNGRYIGRMCEIDDDEPSLGLHTCSYPLKKEWFNSANDMNNVTLTGGGSSGCFNPSSHPRGWEFRDVKLSVWESGNASLNFVYSSSNATITVNISNSKSTSYLNFSYGSDVLRAATLEFDAFDVNPNSFDCIYVNGNYLGKVDYQKVNGTPLTWQKVIFDVPTAWVVNGVNKINLSSGADLGCNASGARDAWNFRNLNLSLTLTKDNESLDYNRVKSMLVMSDGDANTEIGVDNAVSNAVRAKNETVEKACEAHKTYGISIFSVAFGNAADIPTLNKTACCDDCSHFYKTNNASELLSIYSQIAKIINSLQFSEQTVNITGNLLGRTKLYPDSFIEFNYSTPATPFNRIPMTFETERFGNNISQGIFTFYDNTTLQSAKVTSYSESRWTDKLTVNAFNAYSLSDYGLDYTKLGDPFAVNIPLSLLQFGNNTILISTGLNSSDPKGGSNDDRIIYTLLLNGFSDYSAILPKANGCSWKVTFQDGTQTTIKVPSGYSGTNLCDFAAKIYNPDDSLDNAVFQLFSNLDINRDGKIDVSIDENNMKIDSLSISKVPSLWGPAIMEIRVWE